MHKLALRGGEPVRKSPFPTAFIGVSFYGEEELKELTDVINQKSPFRHYGIGTPCKVSQFETEAREYFGRRFALALSSGSGALFCAMAAVGAGPGDEIILPSFNWFSGFYAIAHLGALPVFADVDETLNLDADDFERKITSKTKAVISVDFQGCPANLEKIIAVAKKHNITVIDDFAQAIGGAANGVRLGKAGDMSVASFQQNKILSCGEGGIFLTDNEEFFARAVRYHDQGMMRDIFKNQITDKSLLDPLNDFAGNNFRMSELHGAVMLAQLRKLDKVIAICGKNHETIRESLGSSRRFKVRYADGDCGNTLFMLFKTKNEAHEFEAAIKAEGIPTGATSACRNLLANYPIKNKKLANDKLPPFGKGFEGEHIIYDRERDCPNTDDYVNRYVAVAIGPQFTEHDIGDLIKAIKKVDELL